LKEEMKSLRQRIVGHRKEWLKNYGKTATSSDATDITTSESNARRTGQTHGPDAVKPTRSEGDQSGSTHGHSEKHATSEGTSEGQSETLVPIHEDYYEVSKRTYYSFEEQRTIWAQHIRSKRTGEAFGKFRDDPRLYDIAIDHHPILETPTLLRRIEELRAKNFESDLFRSKQEVERESEVLRRTLLTNPKITFQPDADDPSPENDPDDEDGNRQGSPFR
ncbi:MAG: hypothetical protein KDA36_05125, partial [Planctomycetaceae bacterium]|nr:hypothetical protein [Planctomycetaceae bacterium]